MSKAYGLPGLRIGWVVAPPALVEELWGVHDYTTIAPGALNDRLARIALEPARRRTDPRAHARHHPRELSDRAPVDRTPGAGSRTSPPEAGAIVFVRYRHPINSTDLVERLRDEQSVLVVPGDHFDMDGYLRIGFGSDPAHLSSALTSSGSSCAPPGLHAR